MLTPRQQALLRKVVVLYSGSGQPVGSKTLATDSELGIGSSTIRSELAILERFGFLENLHTSSGRRPTEAGHRYYVDNLLDTSGLPATVKLELAARSELDGIMQQTSQALSAYTQMLAVVSAPPVSTATVAHVEVLQLQPQAVTIVVINSAGEVARRALSFESIVDSGLVAWAKEYLNDLLIGEALGSRRVLASLRDPSLSGREREFIAALSPVFDDLAGAGDDTVFVSGTANLLNASRDQEIESLDGLVDQIERRDLIIDLLRAALRSGGVTVRIGSENQAPSLNTLSVVGASYGTPQRKLGVVSVIGPIRMDYGRSISSVRNVAWQLSRYVEDLYG